MPRVIPFGDRLLVKRDKVGEKIGKEGIIIASDELKEKDTDLAVVVSVPEHSFTDKKLIENAEKIVESHTEKAQAGDSEALLALIRYNNYLNIKAIQPGDKVMISKYVGITFHDNKGSGDLTLVDGSDIIGRVQND